ncbi:MAG: hypothetical protein K9N47_09420 [Prosthecobacter sp.]|uniref:hypothetical protein n=1 Tax=Prosthecobacter sp. TaxID=1965333 RepID=UPI0025D2B013|nr:hypothetical protein [Prosthecobacter sp.]MCF7786331.1 hypothetical protein [Prosthecobacter sp.]
MNLLPLAFDITGSLDISPYLTKGSDSGNGVTLMVGDIYTYLLLGSGSLLVIAAFVLMKVMYARVKFFALEFGNGGFFDRIKAIAPSIIMGSMLFLIGVAATWLGWQSMGYSVTLSAKGLHEVSRSESVHYEWSDATSAAERIKSTEFWVAFAKNGRKCRVEFQQRFIGEKLQDKAIAIAEQALAYSKIPRIK